MYSDTYQNLVAYDHAISTALEDQNTLIAVSDKLNNYVSTGIDVTTAKLTNICVDSIAARLGLKQTHIVPCLESFDNKYGKPMATQVALEGVMGFIGKIFEMIANAFKEFIKFLKALWKEIFNKSEADKDKSEWDDFISKVKKKMNSGESIKEQRFIKDEKLVNALYLDGKSDYVTAMKIAVNTEHLFDILDQYTRHLEITGKTIVENMNKFKEQVKSGIPDNDTMSKTVTDCYETINKEIGAFFKDKLETATPDLVKKFKVDNPDNKEVYYTQQIAKGIVFVVTQEQPDNQTTFIPKITTIGADVTIGNVSEDKIVAADATSDELIKLAEQTKKLQVDYIFRLIKHEEKFTAMLKNISNISTELSKEALYSNIQNADQIVLIKSIAQNFSLISKFMQTNAFLFFMSASSKVKNSSSVLKAYAHKSAKAYEKKVNL